MNRKRIENKHERMQAYGRMVALRRQRKSHAKTTAAPSEPQRTTSERLPANLLRELFFLPAKKGTGS